MDDVQIGKYVRARVPWRGSIGWLSGKVKEIKRDGGSIVLDSGWNINLDHEDELIWCADKPCPSSLR